MSHTSRWQRTALVGLLLALCCLIGGGAGIATDVAAQVHTPTVTGPSRVVVSDLSSTETAGPPVEIVAPRHIPSGVRGDGRTTPRQTQGPASSVQGASPARDLQSLAAPSIVKGFEGLDNNDDAALTSFTVTPPDPQLAIGPNHVFEMINIIGRIYNKSGGTVQTFTLRNFFGVPAGWRDTDPKIIYDAASQRWFASYVSFIDNASGSDFARLHLAVSQTSDPTGAWNIYFVSNTD